MPKLLLLIAAAIQHSSTVKFFTDKMVGSMLIHWKLYISSVAFIASAMGMLVLVIVIVDSIAGLVDDSNSDSAITIVN